jgi:cytochrome P450
MLYVTSSPKTYTTLQQEIDSSISKNLISMPITASQGQNLPYLQACIKESLRMLPPVVSIQSKEVPEGGDTINGIHVPAGTNIGYVYL